MLAIIRTGGKQYIVSPGQKIKIEKIEAPASAKQEITFKEVLLLLKGKKLEIGDPLVKKAEVIGKILKQAKGEKIIVFKYRRATRYKLKKGHRQSFTEVEITKIES